MNTFPIDLPRARELLKQAMDTQGRNFVYNDTPRENMSQCFYLPQNDDHWGASKMRTGCLIGTALKLAGVPETELNFMGGISGWACRFPNYVTEEATWYFADAQTTQDKRGATWGQAYDYAESRIGTERTVEAD
jgi:hypothetical protein